MPTDAGKTRSTDLSALLEGLLKADVKFILVGGLAAVIQGAPISTLDVDIVHEMSAENVSRLFAFLTSVEAIYRRPDDKVLRPKEQDLFRKGHALFTTILGPLDVLAFIEQGEGYEKLLPRTVQIEFRGRSVQVLDIKAIVELKKSSRNSRDRQRLPVLEEILRQQDD